MHGALHEACAVRAGLRRGKAPAAEVHHHVVPANNTPGIRGARTRGAGVRGEAGNRGTGAFWLSSDADPREAAGGGEHRYDIGDLVRVRVRVRPAAG